jgi:hypothetical protein
VQVLSNDEFETSLAQKNKRTKTFDMDYCMHSNMAPTITKLVTYKKKIQVKMWFFKEQNSPLASLPHM